MSIKVFAYYMDNEYEFTYEKTDLLEIKKNDNKINVDIFYKDVGQENANYFLDSTKHYASKCYKITLE